LQVFFYYKYPTTFLTSKTNNNMDKSVIITSNLTQEISNQIERLSPDSVFLLTDTNTYRLCLPLLAKDNSMAAYPIIEIPSGDENKNLNSLSIVWEYLSSHGATRKSLLINIGGGMTTDLGGFAASTFKRGIHYINVPTSLLGAVDAAVGGKTGINFNGLKNEVGVIQSADAVILYPEFFRTLDTKNILSGYAEMLKHALLKSEQEWKDVISFDFDNINYDLLGELTQRSIAVKEAIVAQDPTEQNIRKALNLGHTFGHAFESFSYTSDQPLLHGYAVAFGMICEIYLSQKKLGFPAAILSQLVQLVKENYGIVQYSCKNYDTLYELMTHDKKNDRSGINFTLMGAIGDIRINQHATKEEIFEAFDFLADCLGI
jgi:3-dehydroquinate synthase